MTGEIPVTSITVEVALNPSENRFLEGGDKLEWGFKTTRPARLSPQRVAGKLLGLA